MRNLRVCSVQEFSAAEDLLHHHGREGEDASVSAFDSFRNQLVLASSSSSPFSGKLLCVSLASKEVCWTLSLPTDLSLDKDRILGLEFMMDNEILVVGTRSGQLLSVLISSQSVEVVGNVEGGIIQMSASPDGELLVIATGLGMLLFMTPEWDVLYEIPLVSSEGRSMEVLDDSSHSRDGNVRFSWRSDGKYFATLSNSANLNHQKELCIWERDTGALHSRSQGFSSTTSAVDWISNGSRLASVSSLDSDGKISRVVFFERNGLQRGYFDVEGGTNMMITCVKWNCNGELFAVLLEGSEYDAIQIWSFSNYHWYLKQEWRFPKENRISFLWSPEDPMHIFSWTLNGSVRLVKLCWDSAIFGDSIALVIDGSCLLVTQLAHAVIPPPMSSLKLKLSAPIQAISLHPSEEGGNFIAASLSTGVVSLLLLPSIEAWDALEGTEMMIPDGKFLGVSLNDVFPSFQLLAWLDSEHLVGIISRVVPMNHSSSLSSKSKYQLNSETLFEFEVQKKKDELLSDGSCKLDWMLTLVNQTFSEKSVLAITKHPLKSELAIEYADGSLFSYGTKEGLFQDETSYSLKSLSYPSFWIQAILTDSSKTIILALDVEGRLQIGSHLISTDCTSFTVHSTSIGAKKVSHVLYTTKQDLLRIINLEEAFEADLSSRIVQDLSNLSLKKKEEPMALQNPYRKSLKKDFLKERTIWERGARLVASIGGSGAAVILQTIRGNLETIYPRNLVLGSIVATLCDSKFNEALLLARRHHINLNLIIDFKGWEAFVQCSVEFIKQVKNLNYITEFICAVSAGNFADSIYRDLLLPYMKEIGDWNVSAENSSDSQPKISDQGLKVRSVMRAIRKALEDEVIASPKRELCILTTMAKSDPPELEEALQKIKKLREEELDSAMEGVEKSAERLNAEDALKHLLWLSNPESLFNAALGVYDLHLAAMVANNAQRDPKEFLPLLQELERMPPPVMRYTIDLKLQRFESALKNLASAGDSHFNECLDLLKKNPQLFPLGKQIFQSGPEKILIMEAWGDHLFANEKFEDAGGAFCSCSQFEKALAAYRAGGLWHYVLVVGGLLGFSSSEMLILAQELRDELQALGKPGDAAKVALEYCKDLDDAINLFIEAREWMEAVRVAYSYGKPHLVKDVIEPSALDCAASYVSEFEEGLEKLGKYLARHNAVKQRRLLLEIKLKNDVPEDIEDDAASEASSNLSGMSAYTTGSTKSSKFSVQTNQKHRVKSRSGKIRAGSPGEEVALIEHLKGMELRASILEAIQKLLHTLVLLGHSLVAEKLQHVTLQFQTSQRKAVLETDDSNSESINVPQYHWFMEVLNTPRTI